LPSWPRAERGTEQEFAEALRQIGFISRLRLAQRVSAASLQAA
jgi:2-oxo-4-hydroxy-4-carboxy-5-ureidoimidazoline decarboxylase